MAVRKVMLWVLLLLAVIFACAAEEERPTPPFGDFSAAFEHKFLPPGQEAIREELIYRSQDICIEITPMRRWNTDIYVADIYVRSTENFQRAFGNNRWGTVSAKVAALSQENQAVLGMTGDNGHNLKGGWVVGNGIPLRQTINTKRDLCVLYRDGVMETYEIQQTDYDALKERMILKEIWQCFLFGPALLDGEGRAKTEFNSNVKPANPRSVIGYYEPGHYCFVQADGRGAASKLAEKKVSTGLTMKDLSLLMEELGCKAAYNLDGGQSSMMYFGDGLLSTPYKNGRQVGDIVLIREVEKADAEQPAAEAEPQ